MRIRQELKQSRCFGLARTEMDIMVTNLCRKRSYRRNRTQAPCMTY